MSTPRPVLAGLLTLILTLGLTLPYAARAQEVETFDATAASCAIGRLGEDPVDGTDREHFDAAETRAECLLAAVATAEDVVEDDLLLTIDRDERRLLRRRRKLLRRLGGATLVANKASHSLSVADEEAHDSRKYEKLVRDVLQATTDLRWLGLDSYRLMWQQLIAGTEARKREVEQQIDEALEELAEVPGARDTPQGAKAQELAALAALFSAEMDAHLADLDVPRSELPTFGSDEDKAARRRRKQFKGSGRAYGTALMILARVADKVRSKVELAVIKATAFGPCVYTNRDVKQIGGGEVRISVDGAPEVKYAGQTDLESRGNLHELVIGSDNRFVEGRPYLLFFFEGTQHVRVGTHELAAFPERGPDGRRRDYVAVQWIERSSQVGDIRHVFPEGTVTITMLKTSGQPKRRLIEGTFDVTVRTLTGTSVRHLRGSFHLCKFKILGENGLE